MARSRIIDGKTYYRLIDVATECGIGDRRVSQFPSKVARIASPENIVKIADGVIADTEVWYGTRKALTEYGTDLDRIINRPTVGKAVKQKNEADLNALRKWLISTFTDQNRKSDTPEQYDEPPAPFADYDRYETPGIEDKPSESGFRDGDPSDAPENTPGTAPADEIKTEPERPEKPKTSWACIPIPANAASISLRLAGHIESMHFQFDK